MFRLYSYLFFILFCFVNSLQAQNPLGLPLVLNYGKVIYNGGSRTWDIKQDNQGIMYFGNNEGLLSFNGTYWKQFKLPNQTIVRSIHVDNEKERIFVGGQGEFGYFEKTENSGLTYKSLIGQIPASYRQFADIWRSVGYENGVYFMASNYIYRFQGDNITVYPTDSEWFFMGVVGSKLYAQDRKNGLLLFDNNQWKTIVNTNPFLLNKVSGLIEIGRDSILVTLQNNRSFLIANNVVTEFGNAKWFDMYTPSVAQIDKDKYVIATSINGCQIRKNTGELLEQISVNEGLQNSNVTTVFVDRQQNVWAAIDNNIAIISYGGGVRYIRPNILHEVMGYSTRVHNNYLYLSSSNGIYMAGINSNSKDQSVSTSLFSLIKGSDGGEAWRLDEVNGRLLLHHNKGVYAIANSTLSPIASDVGSWLSIPLETVYPIKNVLVGTYYGFNLLNFEKDTFTFKHKMKGLLDSYRFLVQDADGTLYSSHPYRGVYRIVLDTSLTSYKTSLYTSKNGLPSSNQNYVFKIKNRVVFATENGVYEFDNKKERFVESSYFSSFKGVPLKYMVDDKEGNIWFCSDKKVGIGKFNKKTDNYDLIFFPEIEGMNTSGFENIYPFDLNNIYIGAEKGAIHINFEKYQASRIKPTVLLSQVKAIGHKDSIIFDEFTSGTLFKLHDSFDSFHFEFSSPNYGIYKNVAFSFWLVGNDVSWSAWSMNTEKDYTNLPSGNYTFKVKAKNNLNEESDVFEYNFVINPPWYKTPLAYLLYGLLIVLITYVIIIFQRRIWVSQQIKFDEKMKQMQYIYQLEVDKNEKEIIKLQNEKLEVEVEAKTKELASTSMQLMENSGALSKLRIELSKLSEGEEQDSNIKRISALLKDIESNTSHWDQFASHFDELNDGFFSRLKHKHPTLSRNDLKVCAYLRLNFTTKQIAQLQNISVRGVEIHRYRLRKKLDVKRDVTINDYLLDL